MSNITEKELELSVELAKVKAALREACRYIISNGHVGNHAFEKGKCNECKVVKENYENWAKLCD